MNSFQNLSLKNKANQNDVETNFKLMTWPIPIDYNQPHISKKLDEVEISRRQSIINNFLSKEENGCNEDTKTLVDIIFIQKKNLFLTGVAGTGKSYQLRLIYKLAKKIYSNSQSVVVCSTTGCSALNLDIPDASTIHSWSSLLIEDRRYRKMIDNEYVWCEQEGNNYLKSSNNKIKNTELLIVDEISMAGGFYLKTLDAICKQIKKNNSPMGGIQIVFIGDIMQLSPVKDVYPFLYKVWDHLNLVYYRLTKCYRQTDEEWSSILNKVRIAHVFTKGGKVLTTLDNNSIKKLQERNFQSKNDVPDYCLFLYNKNKDVAKHNLDCLNKIEGELHTSISTDSILVEQKNERLLAIGSTGNEWDPVDDLSILSSSVKRQINKDINSVLKEVEEKIQIKIGARLLLRKNLNKKAGLVNGSRGIITDIKYKDENKLVEGESIKIKVLDKILVQFSTRGDKSNIKTFGTTEVDLINYEKEANNDSDFIGNDWFQAVSVNEAWFNKFEFINVEYLSPKLRIIRKRLQFPFILAFAISTHKSQGQTLDDVIIDMSECFQPAQMYVALSRCKTLERTYILNFNAKYLYSDPKAIKFEKMIEEKRVNK
jgi:ATP-dependent DNA helicase PIF1